MQPFDGRTAAEVSTLIDVGLFQKVSSKSQKNLY